jgi:predicted O-linked N-acetylglucosamine transferase (SPINDLY family)
LENRRANGGASHAGPANAHPELKAAAGFHAAGRLAEAEAAYRHILETDPENFEAKHLLGVLHAQKGAFAEAASLIGEALALDDRSAPAWNNYANVLHRLNRMDEALNAYDRAIALNPVHVEAHNNRGILLHDAGRHDEGLASIDYAIALKPDHASAHYNRATVLSRVGRQEEALASFDSALMAKPDYAEAHNNRGTLLRALGRLEEALLCYDRAVQLRPNDPAMVVNRGAGLHDLGRVEEALAHYEVALKYDSNNPHVWRARGNALYDLRRFPESLAAYDRALALNGEDAESHNVRGNTLRSLNRTDEALAAYDRAVTLSPTHAKAHHNRGILLENLGRYEDALIACDTALLHDVNDAEAMGQGFLIAAGLCDWRGLAARRETITGAVQAGLPVPPYAVLVMADDPALQAQAAENYTRSYYPVRKTMAKPPAARAGRSRRRVAYVSADFFAHATAHLAAGLFEAHDRDGFEIYGVSIGPSDGSAMRQRLEASFDRFIDAAAKPDHEVARLLAALDVDIAVDLKGHTRDGRPGIFAHRPAPIQISYLGYPGTMGAPYIDYIMADETVIPPGAESFYRERVVRLPDSYQVNDSRRRIAETNLTRADFGLPESRSDGGGFVFCSFNNPHKLNPETFDAWLDILRAVPDSVLWIYVAHARARDNLRDRAADGGVAKERLVFADFENDAARHLARLKLADLVLDSQPYNAHTTASDALWAGVPILTWEGQSFPARVAASVLRADDAADLITASRADYIARAKALASDSATLHRWKDELAARRKTSALFDTSRTARHIEAAYRTMWDRHLRGLPPEGFAVERDHV